ncbi:putative T7SS-secreted protein [Streptomyces fructofermentans]|uniref:putative T7SS-secreted protein n=1 Tax=Streptomyces fructofermentans TaxID=152141 RepID=UPI0037989534
MTVTSGLEPGPLARSRDARDNALPQGLKSSPRMPNADYPHLGFDPVPGSTETVRGLHVRLTGCAKVLEETRDLVTRLMDGSYWKGDAAVAFREQLDGGPLPLNLKNAAHSLGRAARQLKLWEGELDEFQCRARRLEEEAKAAREAVGSARGRAATAGDDPDLEKKGAGGEDAQKALTRANTAVDEAEAELEKILGRARRLAEEHERQAEHRATRIREATRKLVPREPGCFDSALDWLSDNLPDILSFVAGVVGVAALILAGPLGWGVALVAGLMMTASALSLTAFVLRLTDPQLRASLWDGISKGELDADFWSNTVSAGSDLAGALPGLGAAVKGGVGATNAIRTSTETLSLGRRMALYGTKTMDEARTISGLENGLITRAVRGCRNPEGAANAVGATSGVVGVGTASLGLYNNLVDAEDDGIKDGAVAGIDGTRLVLDNGGVLGLVRHVF